MVIILNQSNNINHTNNIFTICYYNKELKYLHLGYPNIEEQTEECWEINILNLHEKYPEYNIIENTENMFLEADYYHSFPQVFLKFLNLKKIEICGSRWWNLNCNQIPISVEHLIMTQHTNLQNDVMKGGESLINLHTLELDYFPFFGYCNFYDYNEGEFSILYIENIYPIADIGKLKKIILHTDRKSTRLNSSHTDISRMPSSA